MYQYESLDLLQYIPKSIQQHLPLVFPFVRCRLIVHFGGVYLIPAFSKLTKFLTYETFLFLFEIDLDYGSYRGDKRKQDASYASQTHWNSQTEKKNQNKEKKDSKIKAKSTTACISSIFFYKIFMWIQPSSFHFVIGS